MHLVSVITPAFNCERFVEEAYASLVAQDHQNWEWLVTDDCSNDATFDKLKNIAQADSRVRLFQNEINSGAAVSRNRCMDEAKGEYLAFLDSDDLWMDNKLSVQLRFMDKGINFSFTSYLIVSESGESLGRTVDAGHVDSVGYQDMLMKKATLGCSTVMLRSSSVGSLRMPDIRTGQDYAFWLKILKAGERAYLLNQELTKYRIVNSSISRNKIKKAARQWNIYRRIENLPLLFSMNCFVCYAMRATFRK